MIKTSFATKPSKNLLLLINMAEFDKVDVGDGDCEDKTVKRLPFKNSNGVKNYLTPKARLAFIQLRKAFIEALIFQHFDLKCHIQIKIDASRYNICSILSQVSNLGQWHSVAYYLQKMILAKTQYETHNYKFLAIVEEFKIWQYYLKDHKNKVFVITDHNHLCHFIDTKSLSSC